MASSLQRKAICLFGRKALARARDQRSLRKGNYIFDSLVYYGFAPIITETSPNSGLNVEFNRDPLKSKPSDVSKAAWTSATHDGLFCNFSKSRIAITWPVTPKLSAPRTSFAGNPESIDTCKICFPNPSASSSNNFHETVIAPLSAILLSAASNDIRCWGFMRRGCRAAISFSSTSFNSAVRSFALAAASLALAVSDSALAIDAFDDSASAASLLAST